MATTSDCVGILKVAIHLQEGEILELFPHIGLCLRMHYYDDLAGKVYIDSNADIQNTLESFTEEWSSENPRKNFLVLHVEDCINHSNMLLNTGSSDK